MTISTLFCVILKFFLAGSGDSPPKQGKIPFRPVLPAPPLRELCRREDARNSTFLHHTAAKAAAFPRIYSRYTAADSAESRSSPAPPPPSARFPGVLPPDCAFSPCGCRAPPAHKTSLLCRTVPRFHKKCSYYAKFAKSPAHARQKIAASSPPCSTSSHGFLS